MTTPMLRAAASWAVASMIAGAAVCAFAGGSGDDDSSEDNLRYIGFVKDQNGRGVAAAQVSTAIKGSVTLTANTDVTGAFKIPVPKLLPGVSPENITLTCSKAGFRQQRTLVKSNLNQKPLLAVEVDCILQQSP